MSGPGIAHSKSADRIEVERSSLYSSWCALDDTEELEKNLTLTLCEVNPATPGPHPCPPTIGRVTFGIWYSGFARKGRAIYAADHYSADGTLVWTRNSRGNVSKGVGGTIMLGPGPLEPGDRIELTIRLRNKSLRRLEPGECVAIDGQASQGPYG